MSHGLLPARTVADACNAAAREFEEVANAGSFVGDKLAVVIKLGRLAEAVASSEIQPAYVSVSSEDFAEIEAYWASDTYRPER